MLEFNELAVLVRSFGYSPLFVTVSGAHLYGFPSPDSDIDLRGCHQLPLRSLVGLETPIETEERKLLHHEIEVELVSHEIGKYFRMLIKNNGYVLEQIFSPLVVVGEPFLLRLRPLAKRCITRHHYHHYRGFLDTQRKLLAKEAPKKVKTLLYAYRVVLTGIHLLSTGEVEANLPKLAKKYGLLFCDELIATKTQERATVDDLDWSIHDRQLSSLEVRLEQEFQASKLPEQRDRIGLHDFLIECRLGATGRSG